MTRTTSDNELLQDISGKLDRVIGLLAIQGNERDAQIKILYSLGFDSSGIGRLLGVWGAAVPLNYFLKPSAGAGTVARPAQRNSSRKGHGVRKPNVLGVPSETEILDISRNGEDQLAEFKGQGTEFNKISREIAAMLNTREGG